MDKLKWIRSGITALLLLGMASCAKENLPAAEEELKSYNNIYLVQAGLTGNINFKVYVDADKRDTAFNVVNVTIGGTTAPDHDIPIQFETLDQTYVDAYNTQKGMTAKLLPAANFSLDENVSIKKGTLTTGTLPLRVNLDGLSNGDVYVLPVKFKANDPAFPVDPQLQIAYYVFTCQQKPVGKYIGNIPQLNDPGVRIFDFYDDLMLRDAAGDLWVYPLKGRETLGAPVKVASGFDKVTSLFFNSGYNRLIGVITEGPYLNSVVSWSITNMPDVKIGDTVLAYKSADFASVFSNTFFQGVNGAWYGVHATGNTFWYFTLNASATAATRNNINGGWIRDVYRDPCIIKNAVVVNHPTGLLVYLLAANGATFATDRWQVGKGFFKYSRIFSYKNKDLIGIKANGDLIRYADFDINGFYVAEL
ncbi:DUF1735 domain-containing protein [Niabella pedocola]|uniref:DUF1735 domain-containing protein n=1 Tax=Niabella pedocola TaxID=1752077 RepID=A0ABS8PMC2_9BACT|nr:DUF1735 domain-containing protein [Niabella pedocola]MCD2422247.1 DUF1735 domain-containing protein [Niabella pedocola]